MKIEIGAARSSNGYLGVDVIDGADISIDLEKGRIPIDDGTVEWVNCSHLLEHLDFDSVIRTLEDIHRILKPSGTVSIVSPDTDSNAFWKGFVDHKDLRMNQYFFKSLSTQQIKGKFEGLRTFMEDYEGYGFGMKQPYMPFSFDFKVMAVRAFPTYKYAASTQAQIYKYQRSLSNVIDSYRVFLRQNDGNYSDEFNYESCFAHLPFKEVSRELEGIAQSLRRYNDIAMIYISSLETFFTDFSDILLNMEIVDFIKHHIVVLAEIRERYQNIVQSIDMSSGRFKDNVEFMERNLEIARERQHILVNNREYYHSFIRKTLASGTID